jgi:hypothetical protein
VDDIIPAGDFTMRSFLLMLPMTDETVVIGLTGELLLDALENGVSAYPKTEGRFPIVSGVRFEFRSTAPPGSRVVRETVTVDGAPLDFTREYSVATKTYMAMGKDGYTCFQKGRIIVGDTEASILPNIIRNRFLMMQVVEKFKTPATATQKAKELVCNIVKLRRRRKQKTAACVVNHTINPDKLLAELREKEKSEKETTTSKVKRLGIDSKNHPHHHDHHHSSSSDIGVSSSSSASLTLPSEKNVKNASADHSFVESSDSEPDVNDCVEVCAYVDGRITRID